MKGFCLLKRPPLILNTKDAIKPGIILFGRIKVDLIEAAGRIKVGLFRGQNPCIFLLAAMFLDLKFETINRPNAK